MTDNPEANTEVTPAPAPQEGSEPTEPTFQLADTPEDGPSVDANEVPPDKIFGKYDSMEDAEQAFKEAEQRMHQATEEASTYRKAVENFSQTPQAPQVPAPDNEAMNEQLRGHLEENPFGTIMNMIKMGVGQEREADAHAKSQRLNEFQKFSSDPAYQDVAQEVWQSIQLDPNPNIEMSFLRAKISRLSNSQATQNTSDAALGQRMHVESGGSKPPIESIRVELSDDARRVAGAFDMNHEEFTALNKRVAERKIQGTRDKAPVSIDDWIAAGGAK